MMITLNAAVPASVGTKSYNVGLAWDKCCTNGDK